MRSLDSAFPFHAVVDARGVVTACGRLLVRAAPDLVGRPLVGPPFGARATVTVVGVTLEGPLVPLGDGGFAYLAAPVVRDAAELAGWGDVDLQARKLEAVGQLAAGIAHEINTPVQYVSDSVHFLREAVGEVHALLCLYRRRYRERLGPETLAAEEEAADLPYLEAQIPRAFERVFDGTERVAAIVRAMKEFARPDGRDKAPADLGKALLATLTVCRSEYRYHATVETELGELPSVVCHIGDLNQVFLNLVVNAAHAIADAGKSADSGGLIRVVTTTAAAGERVRVSISDNGCGIPAGVQSRIFDPFFTTKEVGRGTGQGLAISQRIVADHGGTLSFTTAVGRGTTFVVELPHG